MKIPPSYSVTSEMVAIIAKIESERLRIASLNLPKPLKEKIHPFLDGNGRVGRLLIAAVLKARGWDFTFTVPFEEYLDSHKDEYYFNLDK